MATPASSSTGGVRGTELSSLRAKLAQLEGTTESSQPIPHTQFDAAHQRREDGSYVVPGKDDEDYAYDDDSYGVVTRPSPTPPVAPNFEALLHRRELGPLQCEIDKLKDRRAALPPLAELEAALVNIKAQVAETVSKLEGLLKKSRVRVWISHTVIAAEPDEDDERITLPPAAWKRVEDDAERYQHHRQCFWAFHELQVHRHQYGRQVSVKQHLDRLEKILYRLDHDVHEALGLWDVAGQVSEAVQVVLNEAERSELDESSVYQLEVAATIDEIKERQQHPPSARLSRKGGQNYPAVLDITDNKTADLPHSAGVAQLKQRWDTCRFGPEFKDIGEATHAWLELKLFAAEVREHVRETNRTRESRRLTAEEHYGRVRDQTTANSLAVAAMRKTPGRPNTGKRVVDLLQ